MSAALCRAQLARHASQTKLPALARGLRTSDQYRLVRVQLTADVPELGSFGSIVEVKRGRMRNHLFPQGKANYITREQGPQLLQRPDTGRLPVTTRDTLAGLPPLVFHARVRTLHARNAPPVPGMSIHGRGISLSDVKARLVKLGHENLDPPQAVLEWADAAARKNSVERGRLKALGDYGVRVKLLGFEDVVLKVKVEPQVKEEDLEDGATGSASAGPGAPSTPARTAGAQAKVLPAAARKVASLNARQPLRKFAVTATR